MSVARSAKRRLAPAAKTLAPRLFWRRKFRILRGLGESRHDVQLVASLCNPDRVSPDIGADVGEFTIAMLPSLRSVIAFEPRPAQARELAAMFDAIGAAVRVEAVAPRAQPAGGAGRRPVEEFDAATHQDPANIGGIQDGWAARGGYVNNFVFVPKGQ